MIGEFKVYVFNEVNVWLVGFMRLEVVGWLEGLGFFIMLGF